MSRLRHPTWPGTANPILIGHKGAFSVAVLYALGDTRWDYVEGVVHDVFEGSVGIKPTKEYRATWDTKVEVFFKGKNADGRILTQLTE